MRKRRKWLLVGAVILAAGLSYTAYSIFGRTGMDYLTVSEVRSQAESIYGQRVGVEGKVAPGSVDWDDKAQVIRFVLTDDRESVVIVYDGIVPDNFKPGADLVVEGRYRPDGVFEALNVGSSGSFCSSCH